MTRQDPRFPTGRYHNGVREMAPLRATYDDGAMTEPRPRCPVCLNQLVERSGNRGKFWGCGNYPHCRFTISDAVIQEAIRRQRLKVNTAAVSG